MLKIWRFLRCPAHTCYVLKRSCVSTLQFWSINTSCVKSRKVFNMHLWQRLANKPLVRCRWRQLSEGNTSVTPLPLFSPTLHSPTTRTALPNSSACKNPLPTDDSVPTERAYWFVGSRKLTHIVALFINGETESWGI